MLHHIFEFAFALGNLCLKVTKCVLVILAEELTPAVEARQVIRCWRKPSAHEGVCNLTGTDRVGRVSAGAVVNPPIVGDDPRAVVSSALYEKDVVILTRWCPCEHVTQRVERGAGGVIARLAQCDCDR